MENKTQIKKIILELEGKEISLSVESAKKLKGLLDELFKDRETVYVPIDRYYTRPWYWGDWKVCTTSQQTSINQNNVPPSNTIYCSLKQGELL